MRRFRYQLVNVFVESSAATFGGNPLCVFENAHGMTDAEMQALAAQFNLSETTFILPRPGAHPQVRIFTPGFEMPFAGHPTIGTSFVASALGLDGCAGDAIQLALKVGDIPVTRDASGAWTFTANAHSSRASGIARAEAARMLGLDGADLAGDSRYVDNGSEQLVVPVRTLDALARVNPDPALLKALVRTRLDRYLAYVVARVATDRFQVRFFFPKDGGQMAEDPGTGSACACLGGFLLDAGEPAPSRFTVTQGEFVNRLNVLQISLTAERRVRVGGRVLALGGGEIALP
ncbi:MAG: PhzF family phenazine biosynthesis protein [Burkholderiales bacterium]|nr:PhzF family phenazine biosynthesis protein [Burkholderiales bacterium]